MSAPLFPVAATAEAALHAPDGWASRATEAARLAGGEAALETAWVGPAFATREAAAEAYGARLQAGAAWCALRPVAPEGAPLQPPVRALASGPRRWPEPAGAPALWRLQVSWWRPLAGDAEEPPLAAARHARRAADGPRLDARALGRLAAQPLRPVRPQQPLDVGLFERPAPEAPDRLIPDE